MVNSWLMWRLSKRLGRHVPFEESQNQMAPIPVFCQLL